MKFSVYVNGKQANNINGFPDIKGSEWDEHRFTTYGQAFNYAKAWAGKDNNKIFNSDLPKNGYYTCLNEGKISWSYGKNVIEIRREEEDKKEKK